MVKKNLTSACIRPLVFLLGMLLYGFSVGLMAAAKIGVSPISSISYAMTYLLPGMTLGIAQMLVNLLMVLAQILWLGKGFRITQLLQIPASLIFSLTIDGTMPLVNVIAGFGAGMLFRCALFLFSLPVMAFGLSLLLYANLTMLPGDGLVKVLAQKTGWAFGRAKVWFDCGCVAFTCVLSYVFLGQVVGIQVGTVIAAFVLGRLVRWFAAMLPQRRQTGEPLPEQ